MRLALHLALLALLLVPSFQARPAGAVEEAALRAALERYVRERAPVAPEAVHVPALAGLASLAGANTEVELSSHPRTRFEGRVPVTVVLREGPRELHRAVVTVAVESRARALVAARPLQRGAELRAGDLRSEALERSSLPEGWLREPGEAVGQRLRRGLRSGQPLRRAWLEPVPRVRRGQIVHIRLQRGALRIEARGIARSDGQAGEWIRVLNQDSRRELQARVVGDGVVHVDL